MSAKYDTGLGHVLNHANRAYDAKRSKHHTYSFSYRHFSLPVLTVLLTLLINIC